MRRKRGSNAVYEEPDIDYTDLPEDWYLDDEDITPYEVEALERTVKGSPRDRYEPMISGYEALERQRGR